MADDCTANADRHRCQDDSFADPNCRTACRQKQDSSGRAGNEDADRQSANVRGFGRASSVCLRLERQDDPGEGVKQRSNSSAQASDNESQSDPAGTDPKASANAAADSCEPDIATTPLQSWPGVGTFEFTHVGEYSRSKEGGVNEE